jgi:hypothetical protein
MPKAEPNGEPASKEELARLSAEYLTIRNRGQLAKTRAAEMQLAKERGELINRKLAYSQLAYLLVIFRQKTLLAPVSIARRLVSLSLVEPAKEHSVSEAIREDVHALLHELADLPQRVTDEHWLETLEPEQAAGEHRQTPEQVKMAQARTTRRRERKTQTMRDLRAKG